jgi:hypothetical protein
MVRGGDAASPKDALFSHLAYALVLPRASVGAQSSFVRKHGDELLLTHLANSSFGMPIPSGTGVAGNRAIKPLLAAAFVLVELSAATKAVLNLASFGAIGLYAFFALVPGAYRRLAFSRTKLSLSTKERYTAISTRMSLWFRGHLLSFLERIIAPISNYCKEPEYLEIARRRIEAATLPLMRMAAD